MIPSEKSCPLPFSKVLSTLDSTQSVCCLGVQCTLNTQTDVHTYVSLPGASLKPETSPLNHFWEPTRTYMQAGGWISGVFPSYICDGNLQRLGGRSLASRTLFCRTAISNLTVVGCHLAIHLRARRERVPNCQLQCPFASSPPPHSGGAGSRAACRASP